MHRKDEVSYFLSVSASQVDLRSLTRFHDGDSFVILPHMSVLFIERTDYKVKHVFVHPVPSLNNHFSLSYYSSTLTPAENSFGTY